MINAKQNNTDLTAISRKRAKLLVGNVNCLTNRSVSDVVSWCYEDIVDPYRAITMIVLCTGWSVKKLLSNSTSLKCHEISENASVGLLQSNWVFATFSSNATSKTDFETTLKTFFIPFPSIFFPPLQELRSLSLDPEVVAKKINENLAKLPNHKFQKVTLLRLQHHINFIRYQYELSSSDIDFIADLDFKSSPHSHYGHRSLAVVYSNLKRYVDSLHEVVSNTEFHFPTIITDKRLGGHRVVCDQSVKDMLNFLIQRGSVRGNSLENIKNRHNNYTLYVVCVLQLCSFLRPVRMNAVLLKNFEFGFKSILIEDKGFQSRRRVPICQFGQQCIANYIEYLKSLSKKYRFLHGDLARTIDQALNSQTSVFHYIGESEIKIFTPAVHTPMILSEYYLLPDNWARHKVKTILLDDGAPTEHVKRFMGHVEDFECIEAKFHTTSYSELEPISKRINDWLESLGGINWQLQI